jgi:hypothetical protein
MLFDPSISFMSHHLYNCEDDTLLYVLRSAAVLCMYIQMSSNNMKGQQEGKL